MASWITQIIGIAQDLMASVSSRCNLHNPTCIVTVGGAFVLLFIVAKVWAYASR